MIKKCKSKVYTQIYISYTQAFVDNLLIVVGINSIWTIKLDDNLSQSVPSLFFVPKIYRINAYNSCNKCN